MTPHGPTNPKIPLIPVLLLLTCLFTTSLAAGSLQISASPTTINTSPSVYSFTPIATLPLTIPATSVIYIDFPSDYSGILPSSPICTNSSSYVLSCSVVSALRISITNFFYADLFDSNFPFKITNMQNPSHTGATGTFTVSIVNPSTTTLVDGTKTVTLTTGSATCALSTASKVIGGTTSVTFTVTPANSIPSSGGLQISFPWWSQTGDSMILSSQTMTCSVSTSSSSGTPGSCYAQVNPSGVGNQLMMLQLPFAVSAGTPLTVAFSNIRNPPVGTSYSVSLTTLDASSLSLDTCSMSILANVANSLTVDSSSFITCLTNANTKVINRVETCIITFTITNPLQYGATIDIKFPTDITLTSGYTVSEDAPVFNSSALTVSSSVAYPDVLLTNAVNSYAASSTAFSLRFITLKQPSSTKPVSFSITTYYGGFAIDTISGVTYSAAAGSLTSITLSGNPSTAGSNSAFTVSFVVTNTVSSSSTITIVFPSEFTTQGTVSCAGSGTKMASPSVCNMVSSTLTISSYATSSITSSDTVSIIISGIVLPPTTKPTSTPFQISTYDGGYMVDTNTATYFSSTVAAITAGLSVTVSSGAVVGGISTYTISFQNKNPIPATGTFQIGLPSDNTVSISSTLAVESGTQTNIGGTVNTVAATVSTISSIVTISFANPLGTIIAAGTTIQVIIPSLVNPPSTALTASFSVKTFTFDSYAIDATTTGLNIAANTISPSDFQTVSISASPSTTGQTSVYTFDIVPTVAQLATYTLSITFPSSITFASSVTCTVKLPTAASSTSCPASGSNVITVTLDQAVGALATFEITVSGVINPKLSTTYTGFMLATYIGTAKVHQTSSALSIKINPSVITTATLTRSNVVPSSAAVYTFDFVPINSYPSDAYIEVIVPTTQLSVSTATTLACTNLLGFGATPTCALKSGSTNTIQITGGGPFSTSEIRFGLDSIVNQAGQTDSDSFIIYVKDTTTSQIIDQVTSGLQSLAQCGSPCLTCSTTNRTACLSCDVGKLWDSVNFNCVGTCVTGTYQSGTSCLACDSKCLTCTGTSTTCSSCSSTSSYPYFYNQGCVTTCPDGYYADSSNTCQPCVSPCNTCSSSSVCKTCIASNYLYNGACSTSCPDGYYKDGTSMTCAKCKSNCLTCSSLSVCTACDSTSIYTILYNQDCYSSCPAGSYTSGSTCVACTSPCLTCSVSATNCLSCIPGLYVNNGQCLSCSSNCATCSGAYDSCSSCSGSYLQGTKCVSTCSDGYYADTGLLQCVTCTTGCLTCTSKTKCTACDLTSSTPYMYDGSCVSSCPSGTSTSSGTTCTNNSGGSGGTGSGGSSSSSDEEIVNPYDGLYREGLPFPFLIFALIFCVLSCLGRVIKHQTVIIGNILGFISLIEYGAWIALAVLLPLSHPDESISKYAGLPLILVALFASVIVNIVFYFRVIKQIVKSESFIKWKNGRKINRVFAIISQICSIISLKSFRLIYSCFFNLEPMSAKQPDNTEYTDYLSTFYKYIGLNFFLGVLPAFIAAVITINKDSTFSQTRNISIEIMILALFTVALTIFEALRAHEEEKKKTSGVAPDQTNLMIDDSVVKELNSEDMTNQVLSKKGKGGSAARRDSQGGVEGVEGSEYNEADTQGLNQSSSFINLNNSMMTEKRLDAKNDESFDGVEGAQVREENSKIEAIEEIEKDDEDDEPALNMNTKTMSKLQDMLRGKGTELAPQKILIENADGSIIVLKDPSPRKARKKANGDDDSEQELELQDSFEKVETKKGDDQEINKANNILDDKELKGSNEGLLGKSREAEDFDIVNSGVPKGEEMLSPIQGNAQTPVISEGFAPELEDDKDGKGKKKGEDGFEYASSESQVSADDLHNHFMEDTPSNYNVLNQRYDEEFVTPAVMLPKKQVPELGLMKDSMNGSPPKPIVMQHNFMEKERTPPQVDYSRNLSREYPPPRSNSSAEKQTPQSMQNRTGYGKPMLGERSKIMAETGMRLVTPQKVNGPRRVPDSDKGPRNRSGTPTGSGSGSSYKASGSLDKKKGDVGVKGSRTGRLSDKDKPSTDRVSELETMYIKKNTGNIGNIGNIGNVGNNGSVKSSLSKISKKQVNPQRSGDEELSDNDELELDNFGKFEEFVNGMRRPSVQKFDADSFDREIS